MKPIKFISLTLITTFSISLPAYGDQCAYITKEQALRAVSLLNLKQSIYLLCEPCNETIPQPIKIESISVGTVDYEDFWQVFINGKGIDLAYTFIPSGVEQKNINLAAIAGCAARNVSPFIP